MDYPALYPEDPKTQGALFSPSTMAMLSLGANLMKAGGPSPYPVSFGSALGNAFSGFQGDQQRQALVGLEQSKMSMLQQQLRQAQAQFAMQQGILKQAGLLGPQVAPTQLASAGPTTPGMSPATSNLAFGTPDYATAPQTPPAPAPQSQFPFNLQQLTAMKLAGMPDLLPNYKESQPDIKIEGGIIRDMRTGNILGTQPIITPNGQAIQPQTGPNGTFSVSGVPGADAIMRNQKRIEAEEGARYQVHPVTTASGATVPTFGGNLPGFPGAAPAQAPAPQPTQPTPRPMRADPWSSMPKLPTPMGVGQTTYQRNLDETRAKYAGTLSEKYGGMAEAADQRIALNNQALSLVDKADTGPTAAGQAEVKSWLMKFGGIPESDFANSPSATKALDKDLLNAATQKAKAQFGARITQQEVQLMLSRGSPNVDMPKAAIKYLIESDNAGSNYQKQQASDLGKYLSKGGDPHQFEAWYAKTFPMTGAVSQVHLNTGKRPPLSTFGSR